MMGAKTLEAQIADGTAKVQGDASTLNQLAATMVDFDPRFEIMPGTKAKGAKVAHADSYEGGPAPDDRRIGEVIEWRRCALSCFRSARVVADRHNDRNLRAPNFRGRRRHGRRPPGQRQRFAIEQAGTRTADDVCAVDASAAVDTERKLCDPRFAARLGFGRIALKSFQPCDQGRLPARQSIRIVRRGAWGRRCCTCAARIGRARRGCNARMLSFWLPFCGFLSRRLCRLRYSKLCLLCLLNLGFDLVRQLLWFGLSLRFLLLWACRQLSLCVGRNRGRCKFDRNHWRIGDRIGNRIPEHKRGRPQAVQAYGRRQANSPPQRFRSALNQRRFA